MNTHPQLIRSYVTGALTARRFSAVPRLPAGVQSRTGLPVVSNRAFIAAWTAHRDSLAASARRAREN